MELSAFFSHHQPVPSLKPICVETEIPEPQRLLAAVQAGGPEAFGELCRLHETRLLRQAMTLCGNLTLAEELAQDTLVEAWKCLARYHGRCQFFTWLCAILLNRHRNVLRANRRWLAPAPGGQAQAGPNHPAGDLPDPAVWPDQAVERNEQAALLWHCIQTLPAKHQQVIYLRFYVDNSLEGIAAALGCSVGTVKSRLFHALDKLRKIPALNPRTAHINPKEVTP